MKFVLYAYILFFLSSCMGYTNNTIAGLYTIAIQAHEKSSEQIQQTHHAQQQNSNKELYFAQAPNNISPFFSQSSKNKHKKSPIQSQIYKTVLQPITKNNPYSLIKLPPQDTYKYAVINKNGTIEHYPISNIQNPVNYIKKPLYRFYDKIGKIGFANAQHQSVIPPQYINAYDFSLNFAAVLYKIGKNAYQLPYSNTTYGSSKRWGYINQQGNLKLDNFDKNTSFSLKTETALVTINGINGYINKNGIASNPKLQAINKLKTIWAQTKPDKTIEILAQKALKNISNQWVYQYIKIDLNADAIDEIIIFTRNRFLFTNTVQNIFIYEKTNNNYQQIGKFSGSNIAGSIILAKTPARQYADIIVSQINNTKISEYRFAKFTTQYQHFNRALIWANTHKFSTLSIIQISTGTWIAPHVPPLFQDISNIHKRFSLPIAIDDLPLLRQGLNTPHWEIQYSSSYLMTLYNQKQEKHIVLYAHGNTLDISVQNLQKQEKTANRISFTRNI